MSTKTIQEINRELAMRINAEARANPQSPYANKQVGIANGQVVVITDDLDELARKLREAEPDPARTFSLEASQDLDEVHEIWGQSDAPHRMAVAKWPALRGNLSQVGSEWSAIASILDC
jgi:hypothetical protein